jgi:hypothetical protein
MIAAGRHDFINPNITADNFPIVGTGIVDTDLVLVHFDRKIGSDEVVTELAKLGLKPGGIEHACAFGAKYPEVQRKYPIVFLGSVWGSPGRDRCVPYLSGCGRGRGLRLLGWRGEWSHRFRFAGVRKVLPTPAP